MSAYSGVRIVDCSQGVAGPMAAMLLGDFEAEIVKVEPPGGDRLKDHPGYQAWNRNKTVVTLEPGDPALMDLIAGADIAIFDHAPGVLEELGLDAATLTARHPRLIHLWMPPYGTSGRWSRLPAHHSLLAGLTGIAFRQGAYTDRPIHLILPLAHYGQAITGSAAMASALYERSRSGVGQGIVVSGLHGVSEVWGPSRHVGAPPLPRGLPLGAAPSYRLYQCGCGGWMFLGTLFAPFYHKALGVLGLEAFWDEFLMDPFSARDQLEAVFRTRPRTEWLQLLQDAAVPCAPVGRREDWLQSDPVAEAGLKIVLDHPELGEVQMPAPPIRLPASPATVRGPAKAGDPPAWEPRPVPASAVGGTAAPLAGVRVLDLGTVIAGAYAGCVLANLGADVIKIEPPEGDPFRSDGAPFLCYNRGKRGLGLDLKQPAAREVFFALARDADVVLDNYRLGVRERLGIDYAALKAINPRIVSCSITAYGDRGPRAPMPGFDPLLQAEGGMMAAQGGAGEPILHTMPVNDVATAVTVAFGIVSALNVRERTGEGQDVRISLMAQSLGFQIAEMVTYAGRPPNDVGGRDCVGLRALHRYYACADGWIGLVCESAAEAAGLLRATGLDGDPGEALAADRDGTLAQALEAAFAGLSREGALGILAAAGVPAAPCLRSVEAWGSDWLWEQGFFEDWLHPRLGPMTSVRGYADFSRGPGGFTRPAPDQGEHSREILAELGLSPEQVAELFARGAVYEPGLGGSAMRSAGMIAGAGL